MAAFEGLIISPTAPASASTSAESKPSHLPYNVFINHCGKDTKDTVAKSIYEKLDATGLRVFLDKDELQLGDFFPQTLEEAMASASHHIAIFSENYAHSPWCLAELAFIMKQPNIKFIPIFYHVEPATLRWAVERKGNYADAIYKLEKKRKRDRKETRYSSEKVESWRLALHKASFYIGEIINDQSEEEAKVMNVVNRVLKELKKDLLHVAKHAVGLDELEQDFHDKIALQSSASGPVQIVGIWGMGGAGKTTLAKQIYNKKSLTIKNSSFLFDIREAARKERLHEKQKMLLKELDPKGKDFDFDNVDKGKEILKSRLKSATVLIVLDDVDHIHQLDALLPARESLGKESLIIVTTLELTVLKGWGIAAIYKIKTLNPAHAQQLFCWHAFGQPSPLLGFEEFAEKFIDACRCLPLSLVVLGSQLYGESSKNYWQSQLNKLSRLLPDDITSRLKVSYDTLDKEEKDMFLDVACFFIGWASSTAIAVWDGSHWDGLHGLQRLVNKCLVELEDNGNIKFIRMHEHLRDLGREIANEQSPYRLWSKEQIIEIQPQQEAIRIRGMADAFGDNCYPREGKIIIHTSQGERILAPGSLGLKIFIGNGDFINEQCSEVSRELVCLSYDRFEHKNLPSWLFLKELRILALNEAPILEDLWERDVDQAPLQLRELLIGEGYGLKKVQGLESLRSLEKLIILGCTELNALPSLAEVTSLKKFELRHCNKLEKIESLGSLRSLETLIILDCTELNALPSLAEATSLKKFYLRCCNKLEKIESLESLRSLETLTIYDCIELNALPSLAEATSLKEFDLRRCNKLEKIESLESLRSLETLRIYDCIELNALPSLAEATSLKEFDLRGCNKLEKIESLESLRSLETLRIYDCIELNTLPSLTEATSLKEFDLRDCNKLEKIESLESLRSLETLRIYDCIELNALPSLAEATSLKEFDLRRCNKLEKIESLESLRSLETLRIYDCIELNALPSLAEATSLKEFDLRGCNKLEKIESLESLRSLETLRIYDCIELNTLPSLTEATSLKEFDLRDCNKLEKIESLESLRSLETLTIYDCTELNSLPSLAEATSLKKFYLRRCNKLEKIESLESLRSLQTLIIQDCTELNALPSLTELISLRKFEVVSCLKLEKIQGLESLKSLETLNIWGCPLIEHLPSLAKLTSRD
ncbi:disease resistance protein RPV1 isoform X1 [Cryptomeria japonica]|uniref:disease resistance protein RPV1 isoform X1 n=1 Tax=Cryptomeria japonica TaxID=3369 RepID=UPI0027DA353A|nr:disease resistance protein RPV1 isoform X1 [Cryptomeria japonica]XP_059075575.1 disease resistance protein RPV1 isoform X1 [Cryptomeria japonica]XP_059075576.1 disease resistance protein RPV1 isoform X1 [Cryptomeria japonica]